MFTIGLKINTVRKQKNGRKIIQHYTYFDLNRMRLAIKE